MIEISERITRVTTSSDPISRMGPEFAGGSQLPNGARAPTGARVTLEFTRSTPLSPGQEVRLRYDFAGDGRLLDCVGIAQPTHIVARHGHLVAYHYRLSHWITPSMLSRRSAGAAEATQARGLDSASRNTLLRRTAEREFTSALRREVSTATRSPAAAEASAVDQFPA